ncbi:hypothetical protein LR48_Vigan115s000100 [Vigna angularis]|uniref:Uncharacterized protein n=1 Tax=Phaseolus angularis TaxID=3914 RepID=A0A0L9T5C8_PHAAN|nr:hypothetical protein LR48_Vigan115s000100 [Vigna angularis]
MALSTLKRAPRHECEAPALRVMKGAPKLATTEMIIGMYDKPPTHRWTMDDFHNVVAWPEEQAQASRAGAVGASAMDDEDDEDVFEDAEDDEEEEDSDDSMG